MLTAASHIWCLNFHIVVWHFLHFVYKVAPIIIVVIINTEKLLSPYLSFATFSRHFSCHFLCFYSRAKKAIMIPKPYDGNKWMTKMCYPISTFCLTTKSYCVIQASDCQFHADFRNRCPRRYSLVAVVITLFLRVYFFDANVRIMNLANSTKIVTSALSRNEQKRTKLNQTSIHLLCIPS